MFGENVPKQLIKKMLRIKQVDEDASERARPNTTTFVQVITAVCCSLSSSRNKV